MHVFSSSITNENRRIIQRGVLRQKAVTSLFRGMAGLSSE
jgi:hypothetical protein